MLEVIYFLQIYDSFLIPDKTVGCETNFQYNSFKFKIKINLRMRGATAPVTHRFDTLPNTDTKNIIKIVLQLKKLVKNLQKKLDKTPCRKKHI